MPPMACTLSWNSTAWMPALGLTFAFILMR